MRWTEYPFDWVRGKRHTVRRDFESGPVARIEGGVELRSDQRGVRVKIFSDLTSRNVFGIIPAALLGRRTLDRVLYYCDRYLSRRDEGIAEPIPSPKGSPSVDLIRLDRLLERLGRTSVPRELVEPLRGRILEATDLDVLRMRPYAVADDWGADRSEVLRLFLHATRVGLFNLRWELMCPTCRIPKGEISTLKELPQRFHCETCGIDYGVDFDRRVELCFSVHPAVRPSKDRIYCIGGPFRVPHVVVQQNVSPHETRKLTTPLTGALELRATGGGPGLRLLPAEVDGADEVRATYRPDGWADSGATKRAPGNIEYRPGDVSLHLSNETDAPLLAVLEEMEGTYDAVTAAEVTALQEFRGLFSSEILAPGQEVGVQSIALMFTDLKGSTSMYEDAGDAPAFRRVNRHFDFLEERVAGHRGTVVKTVGDAVMGVFISFEDALHAALEVQSEFPEWCREQGIDPPLVLRIGLHQGPVIVMTANDRLDYFGRTVNMAARIELESDGGDVVMLQEVLAEERPLLERWRVEIERFTAILRGIEGEMELARLRVRSPAAPSAVGPSS